MSEDTLLSQSSTVARGDHHVDPDLVRRARIAAGQAATLLKNDGTLPLIRNESGALPKVALFGRTQRDWFAVGYGSGGDVNAPYLTDLAGSLAETGAVELDPELMDLYDKLCADSPSLPGQARDQDVGDDPTDRDQAWGAWPTHYPEFDVPDALVASAARRNDVAVVVIGRAAGEDREATLEPCSYLLTDAERRLLAQVSAAFERTVVVVDTGNVMDLSWAEEFDVSALLIA